MKRPETTAEWLKRYEDKAAKAYDKYQITGDPRHGRQSEEYDAICDAFRALASAEDERNNEIKKRIHNMEYELEGLIKDTYEKEEVAALLRRAVWW